MKRIRFAYAALAALTLSLPAIAQEASQAFVERATIRSADTHCGLFDRRERLALEMGYWQSRGALLRGGYDIQTVAAMQAEAEAYAGSHPCDDEALIGAADRLKNAFLAFSRTPFMEFKGRERQWTATRTLTDVWAIAQDENTRSARMGLVYTVRAQDPLAFAEPGEYRAPAELAVLLPLKPGEHAPAYAQIVMRDETKLQEPWLGGILTISNRLSTPPKSLTKRLWASDRLIVDAPPYEDDETPGALFLFDQATRTEFETLDPREAILVEFTPSGRNPGETPYTVMMEVGDFKAAAAFSAIERDSPMPAN